MLFLFFILFLFSACANLNSGWEIEGGGYLDYSLDGGKTYRLSYLREDIELPTLGRHFMLATSQISSSGSQLRFFLYKPSLGNNVARPEETRFMFENGQIANLIPDSNNNVLLDQKDDSTWTATLSLYFVNCLSEKCDALLKPVHLTGRFRYWLGINP